MNTELIAKLCALVDLQNAIIRDMAIRLNERDDVDLYDRIAAAQTTYNATLGTELPPAVQILKKGEVNT